MSRTNSSVPEPETEEPTVGDLANWLQANPGWQTVMPGLKAKYIATYDVQEDGAWVERDKD